MSEIDDQLRCETLEDWQKYINQSHTLVVAHSINAGELWVSLIEKAYLQAVSNGYDSQGVSGNEAIYYLSRFIPDGTWDVSMIFNNDKMFDKLQKHFANNEVMVLITIPYGAFPDFEEDNLGLDLNQTYALLNVIRVGNRKLLLIQNPKREKVWTKNQSIQDQKGSKDELQEIKRYQPVTLEDDDVTKEGQFYMDSEDAQKYFKSGTLSWNPSLFPYQAEFHFTWQSEYYKMKDSDMRCRYAPQFLFKKSSLTQKFMIVIARHYQRRNAVLFPIYENQKNMNITQISKPMSMTMYFMKHGKKVKSQSVTGDEVINIIGDPDQEPSSSRIYSMNNQIIKTDFNFTRLKVLNVGIENKDDIYNHSNEDQTLDQRLEEEFSEFIGYFSAVLQMNEIPQRINNPFRFSIFVYSNEPIQCARQLPIFLPQERSIISKWPFKPMLNYSLMEKGTLQVKNIANNQIIEKNFLRKRSQFVNVSTPIVSQAYLKQQFFDHQGIKDQGFFE
ncbi:MAG: putative cysteine proteinase, partial [Streblomastix strix]